MKGFVPSLVWIPSKADPQTKIWVYVVPSGNKSEGNSKRRRNETGKGEEPGKCVFKSKLLLFWRFFLKILFFFFNFKCIYHRLDGREFEWTPGDGDGQGGLTCYDSWGRKLSDTTEQLNWTELNWWPLEGKLVKRHEVGDGGQEDNNDDQ